MRIVLEHGNTFFIGTCKSCKCKFLYQYIDVSLRRKSDNIYASMVECPECKSDVLHEKEVYNINNYKKDV